MSTVRWREREREREGWGKIHGLQRNRKNEEQTSEGRKLKMKILAAGTCLFNFSYTRGEKYEPLIREANDL